MRSPFIKPISDFFDRRHRVDKNTNERDKHLSDWCFGSSFLPGQNRGQIPESRGPMHSDQISQSGKNREVQEKSPARVDIGGIPVIGRPNQLKTEVDTREPTHEWPYADEHKPNRSPKAFKQRKRNGFDFEAGGIRSLRF
jgi:hypothetical protein